MLKKINKKHSILLISILALMFLARFILPEKISYLKFVLRTHKTPPNTIQEEMPSMFNNPKIVVPIIIYKVTSPWSIKTYRDNSNIENTIKKASRILNQADIVLEIKEIKELKIPSGFITNNEPFFKQLVEYVKNLPDYKPAPLKIIFLKRDPLFNFLQAGGVAAENEAIAYVMDRYDADDFRILAHEIGHLFSLPHHDDGNNFIEEGNQYLMEGGLLLTNEEAMQAYDAAKFRYTKTAF